MSQNHKKISELIKDVDAKFFNFDPLVWFRSRKENIIEPIEGTITGEIPKWINGSFLQNGPGAFNIGDVTMNHLFDGMAMLHRYKIKNGKITYQCRFIQSEAYETIKSENRMGFHEAGTSKYSKSGFLKKLYALLLEKDRPTDNTVVSVYPIDHEMYAFTETPVLNKFDPKTLEKLECIDLTKKVNIATQLAHPHIYNGQFYNCGLVVGSAGTQYVVFHIPEGDDKFENIKIIARIPAKRTLSPGYMHSFGITENYFIILEQPLTMPAFGMRLATFNKNCFIDAFKWLENENTFIHLVDRATGQIKQTFEAETFFSFHIVNQYEKDGHVVLDLSCYKDAEIIKGLLMNQMIKMKTDKVKMSMMNNRVLRFVMPLDVPQEKSSNLVTLENSKAEAFTGSNGMTFCVPELLCDYPVEFGTIWYEKHIGRFYKYFYGVGGDMHSEYPGKLIKVDVENKTWSAWQEENAYPSEPIFIPSPDAKSEDDGVVIASIVYGNSDSNRVTLLVLDGKTFKELGRCEFKNLSDPVPKTFHGWFLAEKE